MSPGSPIHNANLEQYVIGGNQPGGGVLTHTLMMSRLLILQLLILYNITTYVVAILNTPPKHTHTHTFLLVYHTGKLIAGTT